MQPQLAMQILLLLVANGAPVLARRLFGSWCAWPLDLGARFMDSERLLGCSKTFRGVIVSLLATAVAAPALGLPWQLGVLVAAAAMAGDLLSSFIKRRLRLAPSSMAPGLDQVPESLFSLLACRLVLDLSWGDILIGVALFWVGEVLLSRVLYALGIRDRPY